jgi:hypothetical protein
MCVQLSIFLSVGTMEVEEGTAAAIESQSDIDTSLNVAMLKPVVLVDG